MVGLLIWFTPEQQAQAALSSPPTTAQELFTQHCAGCHPNGGNIIRRRKTLKQRALERNHVNSVEEITTLIVKGKGIMSAYGDRLSNDEINLLATYVWENAQANWQ